MEKAAEAGEAALELYGALYGIDDPRAGELIANLEYIHNQMQG
jgi:hypothetical protein